MKAEIPFDKIDERVLRYLEQKSIAGGGGDWIDIAPEDIQNDNGLDADQCARIIARFRQLGIVETLAADGTLCIKEVVCHYVAQLDRKPPPDYLDRAKKWAFSKPWLVFPGIAMLVLLPWIVGIVQMVKNLLEWFGVK
jgi:hypothetical protein